MKKILILDDVEVNVVLLELIIKNIFREIGKENDFEIIKCYSSESFFEKMSNDIDLFLLDISIPGEYSGIGLLKYAINKGITSPIIMQTAYLDYEIQSKVNGAKEVIYKPYIKNIIKKIILKYLF